MSSDKNIPEFEEALQELEKIVDSLEQRGVRLNEMLDAVEKGSEYYRICCSHLEKAENRLRAMGEEFELDEEQKEES
jgi:exodeoxyribonuclease VII small subunit